MEIAWEYLLSDASAGPRWLSAEWSQRAVFPKHYADSISLGCDLTAAILWPSGGIIVPATDASVPFTACLTSGGADRVRIHAPNRAISSINWTGRPWSGA